LHSIRNYSRLKTQRNMITRISYSRTFSTLCLAVALSHKSAAKELSISFEICRRAVQADIEKRAKAKDLTVTDEGVSAGYTISDGVCTLGISIFTEIKKQDDEAGTAAILLRTVLIPKIEPNSHTLTYQVISEIADVRIAPSKVPWFAELGGFLLSWGQLDLQDIANAIASNVRAAIGNGLSTVAVPGGSLPIANVSGFQVGKNELYVYTDSDTPKDEHRATFSDTDYASAVTPNYPIKEMIIGTKENAALVVTLFRDNLQLHTYYAKAMALDPTVGHFNGDLKNWTSLDFRNRGSCRLTLFLAVGEKIEDLSAFYGGTNSTL